MKQIFAIQVTKGEDAYEVVPIYKMARGRSVRDRSLAVTSPTVAEGVGAVVEALKRRGNLKQEE